MDEETDNSAGQSGGRNSTATGDEPERPGPEDETIKERRLAHFIRQLADNDEVTRWRSAEALGRIGDPAAVGALIDTLWDEDARVRLKAAWALGAIGDPRAISALRRLYRIEKEGAQEIIKEALEAIAHQGGVG